jgi:nucleoside-diphosphate-sugar epimerase
MGARAVKVDLLDPTSVRTAVAEAQPDAIVHQATALGGAKFGRSLDKTFAMTNRLRTEGTDALLAAARGAKVARFVAQSYAPYRYAREGSLIKTEEDPLDTTVLPNTQQTFDAMTYLEKAVTDFGGIVLRYGGFYGAANDGLIEPVRKRQYPVVGDGGGFLPLIHLDDAAAATVLALEHDGPATYNIVDDESATVRDVLPVVAEALGAKPPRRFPKWLARMFAGEAMVVLATDARDASNAKAKRELGWSPRYPSWRTGLKAAYSAINVADTPTPRPAAATRHAGS